MSEQTVTPPTSRKPKGDQDQRIADRLTTARTLLTIAQNDAELASLLAAHGYEATKLSEGLTLQQAAQEAFSARQQAIGRQREATTALVNAETVARQAYADFRETARSLFKDNAARTALGLRGIVSKDMQKFITAARAGYDAALNTPAYLSELAKYGYPQAALQSARATLDALLSADSAQETAKAAATRATQQRNAAAAALDAWISQFRAIAKVATRGRPDLAKKIGL